MPLMAFVQWRVDWWARQVASGHCNRALIRDSGRGRFFNGKTTALLRSSHTSLQDHRNRN
ncbi:hypothetical protein MESS4_50034 [Mesorhizobium sp. STM 4661]|nr:hypothetical protein MESS4_50034 [Mesorhizobium sp. STM 4661]